MCAFLDFRAFRGEISADQIVSGVEAIDLNARELLDDARFLLENGRYARAMSIAIIAYEEATKSATLLRLYAAQADEKQRKEIWKAYLSHTHKASLIGLREDDIESLVENAEGISKKLRRTGTMVNKLKQHGFYADIYEHDGVDFWSSPSGFVSSDMSKTVVEGVSDQLASQLDESLLQQRKADIQEHVRAMDQHPKSDSHSRFVALVESAAKAEFEAAKRKKLRELREKAHKRESNGP